MLVMLCVDRSDPAKPDTIEEHRTYLKTELEKQEKHLSALDAKIDFYERELKA
jgi:hypothetical protein